MDLLTPLNWIFYCVRDLEEFRNELVSDLPEKCALCGRGGPNSSELERSNTNTNVRFHQEYCGDAATFLKMDHARSIS